MVTEKVLEVLKDESFINRILGLQTQEQVQAAFKEKGIEISKSEIGILGDLVNKMKEKNTTNLSEEDLKEIAGGGGDKFKSFKTGAVGAFTKPFKGTTNNMELGGAVTGVLVAAAGIMAIGAGVGAVGIEGLRWAGKHLFKKRGK